MKCVTETSSVPYLVDEPDARHLANHLDGRSLAEVLDRNGLVLRRLVEELGRRRARHIDANLDFEDGGVRWVLIVHNLAVKLRDELLGHLHGTDDGE